MAIKTKISLRSEFREPNHARPKVYEGGVRCFREISSRKVDHFVEDDEPRVQIDGLRSSHANFLYRV